jgi:hypothetical protein
MRASLSNVPRRVLFIINLFQCSGQAKVFRSVAGYNKCNSLVIMPALMMGMDETIIDRIAFGGVKELEELYQQ